MSSQTTLYADIIFDNLLISSPSNDSFSSCEFSDVHSSDFEWVTDSSDSDLEGRGLDFGSLPGTVNKATLPGWATKSFHRNLLSSTLAACLQRMAIR